MLARVWYQLLCRSESRSLASCMRYDALLRKLKDRYDNKRTSQISTLSLSRPIQYLALIPSHLFALRPVSEIQNTRSPLTKCSIQHADTKKIAL